MWHLLPPVALPKPTYQGCPCLALSRQCPSIHVENISFFDWPNSAPKTDSPMFRVSAYSAIFHSRRGCDRSFDNCLLSLYSELAGGCPLPLPHWWQTNRSQQLTLVLNPSRIRGTQQQKLETDWWSPKRLEQEQLKPYFVNFQDRPCLPCQHNLLGSFTGVEVDVRTISPQLSFLDILS